MTYQETVQYIEEIPKFTSKTALDHTVRLLEELGHPERDFRILHVAGTNGKGSVCAYLQSMLTEGGYRCGLFTSPHLIRINERFQIDGAVIPDDRFVQAFETVMRAVRVRMAAGDAHPTYFETLFLMGMVYFREEQVEYAVLETGMGGRLDATNAVEDPLACVITSVSFDHMQYLGNTLEQIAGEKAGIIKPGVPVIYDGHNLTVSRVIASRAEKLQSPAVCLREEQIQLLSHDRDGIRFRLQIAGKDSVTLKIRGIAEYQMRNAGLAFLTMRVTRNAHGIPDGVLLRGIGKTVWPCRMEVAADGVVIDGAHNEDGIAEFVKTAERFHRDGEITILFAAVSDKRYPGMIRKIASELRPEHVVTTSTGGNRTVDAKEFAKWFRADGCPDVESAENPREALEKARKKAGSGMLFCVGSLYLAGELKQLLQKGDPC